jgi:Ni,Fe-hydrogenase I large subunit
MAEANRTNSAVELEPTKQELVNATPYNLSLAEMMIQSKHYNKYPDRTILLELTKEHHRLGKCEICAVNVDGRGDFVVIIPQGLVEDAVSEWFMQMSVNDENIDNHKNTSRDQDKEGASESQSHTVYQYNGKLGFCKYDTICGFSPVLQEDFAPLLNGKGNFRFKA